MRWPRGGMRLVAVAAVVGIGTGLASPALSAPARAGSASSTEQAHSTRPSILPALGAAEPHPPGTSGGGGGAAEPSPATTALPPASPTTAVENPAPATRSVPGPTPASPPTTAASRPAAVAAPEGLSVSGTELELGGRPYHDVGLDAFELATQWGVNAGCGGMLTDTALNSFFAGLPSRSLVRIWAFQGGLATNIHTGQLDWAPLDRVFAAATAHHDLLVVSLTDQAGTCDDQLFKQLSWYRGGYLTQAARQAPTPWASPCP
jgi:hypothetical protein